MLEDTPTDKEFQAQICGYALRKATNGVYMTRLYHMSSGQPVLLFVAIGEQALATERLIMKGQVQEGIIEIPNGSSGF